MKRYIVFALVVISLLALGSGLAMAQDDGHIVERIMERGELLCGVNTVLPGFGTQNDAGDLFQLSGLQETTALNPSSSSVVWPDGARSQCPENEPGPAAVRSGELARHDAGEDPGPQRGLTAYQETLSSRRSLIHRALSR